MPGETIEIDTANYPDLASLAQGDDVSLKIKGKVTTVDEEGKLEITTSSIEQTDVNPAKNALKGLMHDKNQKQGMAQADDEGSDE